MEKYVFHILDNLVKYKLNEYENIWNVSKIHIAVIVYQKELEYKCQMIQPFGKDMEGIFLYKLENNPCWIKTN